MKKQKDFIIPFKGLGTGAHEYLFEIDDTFFESFEYFESEKGKLDVKLDLIKESSLLDLQYLNWLPFEEGFQTLLLVGVLY